MHEGRALATALAFSVSLLAGCGRGGGQHRQEMRVVPDVVGTRFDVAQEKLDELGIAYERIGRQAFRVVHPSEWVVCDQTPKPGRPRAEVRARPLHLKVARNGECASPTH